MMELLYDVGAGAQQGEASPMRPQNTRAKQCSPQIPALPFSVAPGLAQAPLSALRTQGAGPSTTQRN